LKEVFGPYRTATPPEPDGPDPADVYEAQLRARAARGRRVTTAVCGGIAGLSMLALAEVPPPTRESPATAEMRLAARVTEAREAIASARRQADAEQAWFSDAVTSSSASDASSEPALIESADRAPEPCSVVLPEANRFLHGMQAFPLLVVARGDRDLPSPSIASMRSEARRAEEYLDSGQYMEGILYANALCDRFGGGCRGGRTPSNPARLRYDVVLFTTSMKHPVRTSDRSFEPGEVVGRAYLYDFAEHRVTCAGDVHVTSSRQIEYAYVPGLSTPASLDQGPSLSASLDVDLEIQTQRSIARGALLKLESP
jgi:hypothetical protein